MPFVLCWFQSYCLHTQEKYAGKKDDRSREPVVFRLSKFCRNMAHFAIRTVRFQVQLEADGYFLDLPL